MNFIPLRSSNERMKLVTCTALLCSFSFCAAQADLTIVQNVEAGGPMASMTLKIKGDKARIEAGPQITTIIDSKSGDLLTLMNDQKKFVRVSAAQAKAAGEMAMEPGENGAPSGRPQLKPSGKKEIINGYETEEYVCEAPAFKGSYWISSKYPDAPAILKQLAATTPAAWNLAGKGMPDYRDFPGIPLRTRINFSGKEIVTDLVSIKQTALPDSEFVVPPGFEEMKIPNLDTLLGGKSSKPKPATSSKP